MTDHVQPAECPHGCKTPAQCLRYDQGGSIPADCLLEQRDPDASSNRVHPECPGWDHECQECSRAECECDAIPNRVPITREDEQRALDKGMAEERAKGWRFKPQRSAEEESALADKLHHASSNRMSPVHEALMQAPPERVVPEYAIPNRVLTGDCEEDCVDGCAYPGQFSECELGGAGRATRNRVRAESPIDFAAESERTRKHLTERAEQRAADATRNRAQIVDAIQRAIEDHETADCIDHNEVGECIFPDLATFIADALADRGFLGV